MHPGTLWSNRLKAAAFALALVLTLFSTANWWSIYSRHAPACSPECAADFVTFYAAAKLFVDHPGSLYDIDQQLAYQNQIAPSQQALPFVYPPITAVMMAPLAWLHFSNAFLTVTLLNGVLVWLSLRKLIRHLHLASDQSHWLILFALCNYGVHHLLYQGQLSALILFLLTNYVLLQKERDSGRSGVWMSLLCVKPQFVPMPGLFLFLQGKWRGLIAGAVLSATWTIAAFLVVGAEATQQFFLLLQRMVIKHNDWWNQLHGMHNLRALAAYWLPPATQSYLWWTICGLLILVLAWINLRFRQRPGNFEACWTANMIGLLLVSPHLFTHDLTLLILPCALFLARFKERVPATIGIALIATAALPILSQSLPTITATALLGIFLLQVGSDFGTLARASAH